MFNVEQVRDPETRNLELDASAASLWGGATYL